MSLLSNVNTDAAIDNAVEEDYAGPEFIVDSGIYEGVIDMAYLSQSQSSKALALNLVFKTRQGTKIDQQIWFTNKTGDTFYIDKNDGSKKPLPGYSQINNLAKLLLGKGFLEIQDQVVTKDIPLYNYDQKREVPTPMDVVMPFIGQKLKAGVIRQYEDIGDKDNNYAPSGYSYETNVLDKFFDFDSGQTSGEKLGNQEAAYINKWEARNSGITRDNTENKIGLNKRPRNNTAQASASASAGASTSAQPTQSLFDEPATDDDVPF